MDVVQAIKFYINEMIKEAGAGIKALLMDKETVSVKRNLYVYIVTICLPYADIHRFNCLCPVRDARKRSVSF